MICTINKILLFNKKTGLYRLFFIQSSSQGTLSKGKYGDNIKERY